MKFKKVHLAIFDMKVPGSNRYSYKLNVKIK